MTDSHGEPGEDPDASTFSLAGTMRSGMLWNLMNYVAAQGSGFVIFIILAMRLPPEIFGIVAIAAIAADLIATDGRFACTDAILQTGRFDNTSLNSAFYGFTVVAVLFAAGMVASAHYVGQRYDSALITQFMPVFGLLLLPVPWLAVMDALIMRDLAFKQFTQRNILGTLVGGVVGIGFAFSPWLMWALVAQRIVTLIVTVVYEYRYTKWTPGLQIERQRLTDFLARFFPLWVISSLALVVGRVSTMLFGLRYDTHTVGLFRATYRITEAVQQPIISPMMGMWFPLMAKVRNNLVGERDVYNNILRTAAVFSIPAFAGLTIVADDLITVLLPVQYAGSTSLLQAQALVCIVAPFTWFVTIAMTALGMNKISLAYTAISAASCIAALFAFDDVTAAQAIIIMSIPGALIALVGSTILNRRLGQTNMQHYLGLAPPVIGTVVMAGVCLGVNRLAVDWPAMARMAACVSAGLAAYGAWLFTFHRKWVMARVTLLRGKDAEAPPVADALIKP